MTRNGVALVTGAARGIGAATATVLASRGWAVGLVDLAVDDGEVDVTLGYPLGTATDLEASAENAHRAAVAAGHEPRVLACAADVTDLDSLGAAVEVVVEGFDGLDAVVAAAGVIGGGTEAWLVDEAVERRLLEVNLGGMLNTARATVPAMLERRTPRRGRFVAVSSAAAGRGVFGLAAYSAAKAGVEGAVRALASELATTGITVNAVRPGSTRTPLLDASARLYGLSDAEDFAGYQPTGRLLSPEDVAGAVAYLLSEEASAVTGTVVDVDGGFGL